MAGKAGLAWRGKAGQESAWQASFIHMKGVTMTSTNPPNAIDREDLQETYDAAERMLHGENLSSPGPKVACPQHRGLVSEWLCGGLTRFCAALKEKAHDDCPRSS